MAYKRARLSFESLEDRLLMAADFADVLNSPFSNNQVGSTIDPDIIQQPYAEVSEGVLRIQGSDTSDEGTGYGDEIVMRNQREFLGFGNVDGRIRPIWNNLIHVQIRDIDRIFAAGQIGGDFLFGGTFDADQITRIDVFAGGGNDIVNNLTNLRTIMHGGDGDDVLQGGRATDKLFGDGGIDKLYGNGGRDVLHGGDDDDFLDGGRGGDYLYGDGGYNSLLGGGGHDYLYGGYDARTLFGSVGQEVIGATINGGSGNDWLYGTDGKDLLEGDRGSDHLFGYGETDILLGGWGVDFLYGHAGNDELYANDERGVDEDTTTSRSRYRYDDYLYGGAGDDLLQGSPNNDYLSGGGDADELFGADGNDYLRGNNGDDVLHGGAGRDTLRGGNDNDRLYGNEGRDYLYGDRGNDGLYGGDGPDVLTGGAGADRLLIHAGDAVQRRSDADAVILFADGPSKEEWGYGFDGSYWAYEYVGGQWDSSEVEVLDVAFQALMDRTGNTTLLKMPDGGNLTILRYSSITVYDDSGIVDNNSGSTRATNDSSGTIDYIFDSQSDAGSRQTILHEIGHNWDDENPLWEEFKELSGWEWWLGSGWSHDADAEFVYSYGNTNPMEDFATVFSLYFMDKLDELYTIAGDSSDGSLTTRESSEIIPEVQKKIDLLDDFFALYSLPQTP